MQSSVKSCACHPWGLWPFIVATVVDPGTYGGAADAKDATLVFLGVLSE